MVRMTAHLRPLDLAIVAVYLIGITLFGLRFREKKGAPKADRSLKSYFLANNTIPWWAIALSIVSAETSTLTIISIPGVAFAGDFGFLQIVLGYMLGRIVVAALFLPRYFSGNMMTAYQLIDQRFGSVLHKTTAGLFLLTRAAAEGVRVFAVSIVVGIAIGTRDVLSIAIISALTLLYTFEGGMAAVIWTDVVQMAIYVGGTLVAIWSLGHHIPGGWSTIHAIAAPAGKFHLFNFALNLTTTYTFWAGILGGTFLTMASHGTDQLMVQRMLAARSLRESRLALLSSGVVIFIQFTLFLLIGVGLYVFYGAATHAAATPSGAPHLASEMWAAHTLPAGTTPDRIFPTFIVHEMPIGIAGLLVAAILAAAMSNLSAALNSLSSTTVVDFYMHLRPQADARERTLISKSSTILWALVLFAIAVATVSVGGKGHVVEIGLSIASVAYGCLLGVFLLGTLTRFATQTGATIGMITGFALNLWLWQGTFPKVIWKTGYDTPGVRPDGTRFQGVLFPGFTIPHIAFTWYVLIGALVTFAIGALCSLLFRKQARRTPAIITASLLLFCLSFPQGICVSAAAQSPTQPPSKPSTLNPKPSLAPDFSPISQLLNEAIAAHKLPGGVVLIGHNGKVVFEQAYGLRKLANEPGLDGKPSPAEPMTEDTLFDMASLTKCLATATAVMQLYEAGKITSFDDPVEKYLPAFNPQHDPERAKVTLRMLLTHTSGEAPDVDLRDPWGLAAPDRAEGLRRALTTPLKATPGSHFEYSDINFILLGDLVETLSGESEDVYAQDHIFKPLGMTDTRYLPLDERCGVVGVASWGKGKHAGGEAIVDPCGPNGWEQQNWIPRTAPTAHDNEGTPATNPDFDRLLRGTVHDPTTRRMGGVAGHAGVFSTAHDISLFAQALLDKLTKNTGPFPLKQSTLLLMTTPEQPGPTTKSGAPGLASETWVSKAAAELSAANAASDRAKETRNPQTSTFDPLLAPAYPAIKDHPLRGFGWDIDSGFSKPRGAIFPIGSFGHTGFTGTSLWMDPASNTYVILLANAIHPRGNPPISNLRGELATLAAQALGIGSEIPPVEGSSTSTESSPTLSELHSGPGPPAASRYPEPLGSGLLSPGGKGLQPAGYALPKFPTTSPLTAEQQSKQFDRLQAYVVPFTPPDQTLTGIDVLESTHFAAVTEALALSCRNSSHLREQTPCRVGLLTNQASLDAQGARTIDILAHADPSIHLTTLFTPEHGLFAHQDTEHLAAEQDPATKLPVISLFGPKPSDKHLRAGDLNGPDDLDVLVIDLQDAGTRFWTYETLLGYILDDTFCTNVQVIVLDRPNPLGGVAVQGPVSDPGTDSYVNYSRPGLTPVPIRHGLTFGELAQDFEYSGIRSCSQNDRFLTHALTVIPMQHWTRTQTFAETGLPWVNPSPNLRSPEAALLYPALGLIETTNISVGRGTPHPFSFFGAGIATKSGAPRLASETWDSTAAKGAWFNATDVAAALTARHIPGVTFTPTTEPITEDANHYPFHGQTIPAVRVTLTDPAKADTPELGIEILAVLHRLYPTQFQLAKVQRLLCNQSTLDALTRGDDPRDIAATWTAPLEAFRAATKPFLLYP
jgi:SSS family transporter